MATAIETCAACNGEVSQAKGFELNTKAEQSYFHEVITNWNTTMPGIDTEIQWTVYLLSSDAKFKHYSLLFICEEDKYPGSPGFTVELGISPRACVIPITRIRQRKKDLPVLGMVMSSARNIMQRGLECLAKQGDYKKVTNNCQNFVSSFAKELGVKQPWTDVEKVETAGWSILGAVVTVGAIAYGISKLWSKKNED